MKDFAGEEWPHSIDAEQALLGAVIFDAAALDACDVAPEDFFDPVNGRLWQMIRRRVDEGKRSDAESIVEAFASDPAFEELGGRQYLIDILSEAPDASVAPAYAEIIRDKALRCRALRATQNAVARFKGADEGEGAKAIVEGLELALAELVGGAVDQRSASVADAFDEALDEIDMPGVRLFTGLTDLDEQVGGFRPGGYYVLAGRSSMGKTALGVDLVWRIAQQDRASAIVSIEMPKKEVAARIGSGLSGVPYRNILMGRVHSGQREDLNGCRAALQGSPLTIMDVPGITIASLRSRLRRWKRDQQRAGRELGVVVIDYLQLIRPEQSGSIYEKTTAISRALKPMARELELPLIVLCQLSRESEKEGNKRPAIRHLRDSGAIEEDADAIMLLYRDSYYAEREPQSDDIGKEQERLHRVSSRELEVDVAKNRQGAVGRLSLWADVSINRFKEWR